MKISLRQAHKLVQKINDHIGTIDTSSIVHLNVWEIEDSAKALENARNEFSRNVNRVNELQKIRVELRNKIGNTNALSSISTLIAARKAAGDQLVFLKTITAKRNAIVSSQVGLDAKLSQLRSKEAQSAYGRDDMIAVSLLTDEQRKQNELEIVKLQRLIEDAENKLLELNVAIPIELEPESVATLGFENLV